MANLEDVSEFEGIIQCNEAKRNAQTIRSNIMKLIHIFRREDMQLKLTREFRP